MNSFTYKIVRGLNCGIKFHESKPDEGSKLISQEKFVKPRFCLLHSHFSPPTASSVCCCRCQFWNFLGCSDWPDSTSSGSVCSSCGWFHQGSNQSGLHHAAEFLMKQWRDLVTGSVAVSSIILHGRILLLPGDEMVAGGQILQVLQPKFWLWSYQMWLLGSLPRPSPELSQASLTWGSARRAASTTWSWTSWTWGEACRAPACSCSGRRLEPGGHGTLTIMVLISRFIHLESISILTLQATHLSFWFLCSFTGSNSFNFSSESGYCLAWRESCSSSRSSGEVSHDNWLPRNCSR